MDNGHEIGSLPDEALLKRFVDGDRSAFEALARRHEAALLGLARGLLNGNTDAACDAVQETWLRIIRYARSFRQQSTFKTWVYRIVINQCHNIRSKHARERDKQHTSALHAETARQDPSVGQEPSPAGQPIVDDQRQHLRDEVARLSEDRRLILLLCYHDGMTHQQAAEILEIPIGTLKSRLHAALGELRKRLPSEVRT